MQVREKGKEKKKKKRVKFAGRLLLTFVRDRIVIKPGGGCRYLIVFTEVNWQIHEYR